MILLTLRLLIAALLALTGVSTEDETLSLRGGVTDECAADLIDNECDSTPPSELPGPGESRGLSAL